ncbi:hypothetical protein ACFOW1_04675 [Parasediminibacterium paludis]|uniref:Uncharacterized protein n=1 Tax=Parasediminibacterium paludis TaxID=908966 RepID=A0ABV8PV06_9BACT
MRLIYLLIAVFLCWFSAQAQTQPVQISDPGGTGGNYGSVSYYDPSKVGQKNTTVLTYADVEGTPFWNEKWYPAVLVLKGGNSVKLQNVKLNIYTSDVLYIDNKGTELEAIAGIVQKVIFFSEKDTSKVFAKFEAFPDTKIKNGYAFYRVLADGKYKLLELQRALIRTVPLNELEAKKTASSFYTTSNYAIAVDNIVSPLRALNSANITAMVNPDKEAEQWIKDNKLNLRKETDAVTFFQYLNLLKK